METSIIPYWVYFLPLPLISYCRFRLFLICLYIKHKKEFTIFKRKTPPPKTNGVLEINIGIPEYNRLRIAEKLSNLLADTYLLYIKTHNYHWNVTGPLFQTLHLMFETQYKELATAIDVIAERIRALGVPAPGSYAQFIELSSLTEEAAIPKATDMIKNLTLDHERITQTARSVFPVAEKGDDEATLDLLTQRIQIHEKTAWMLRSLLEE